MSISTSSARDNNARYMIHPMSAPSAVLTRPPIIIERGEGCYVFDIDGNRYFDGISSLWNVNVGHNHPRVNQAIMEQLKQIAYYKTFGEFSNPAAIELSRRVVSMAQPEGMTKVFFSSGGSDADETAFKLARQYWRLEGQAQRYKILSLDHGYHGVHFGGMSASGHSKFRQAFEPLLPGFFQVDAPFLYRNTWNESSPERLATLCAEALERAILSQGADSVAAFIAEPVQGAGGVIVPPSDYWPLVRKVCDKYGVLLIADEVITGFGRVGEEFGCRAWGVSPDMMTFAKGINSAYVPLGATAINARMERVFMRDDPRSTIFHGYTYSGHALACAAGVANLQVIADEQLVSNAATQGQVLAEGLEALKRRFNSIGDVRYKGLMGAIEFTGKEGNRKPLAADHPLPRTVEAECFERGVLIRSQAGVIVLSPPLVAKRREIDHLLNVLESAIASADAAI
ncbi:aminotransferase class III-fold pyridoxal phosphate-dependent enzyme [Variovorax sp. LT1R20]|uniref:aminotransferase class III-fold pyridoxal phosphate-dependent enzyme n=1 Tax=Variovorax sp. LT1R20 TaxID=3443729 RepID=UPI003F491FE2